MLYAVLLLNMFCFMMMSFIHDMMFPFFFSILLKYIDEKERKDDKE